MQEIEDLIDFLCAYFRRRILLNGPYHRWGYQICLAFGFPLAAPHVMNS